MRPRKSHRRGDVRTQEVDDRGIELAEAAVYELRYRGSLGLTAGDINRALAALSAVRTLTKEG